MKTINYNARFIELASDIDTNMPRYVVSRIQTRSIAIKPS